MSNYVQFNHGPIDGGEAELPNGQEQFVTHIRVAAVNSPDGEERLETHRYVFSGTDDQGIGIFTHVPRYTFKHTRPSK